MGAGGRKREEEERSKGDVQRTVDGLEKRRGGEPINAKRRGRAAKFTKVGVMTRTANTMSRTRGLSFSTEGSGSGNGLDGAWSRCPPGEAFLSFVSIFSALESLFFGVRQVNCLSSLWS